MGLDMYLEKETYIGMVDNREMWGHQDSVIKVKGVNSDRVKTVVEEICYWRKANMIHQWFVDKCQDGIDECQKTWVSREKLQELHDLCKDLLDSKDEDSATEKLPPVSGFFFGGTEVDEWYWTDIEHTVKMLGEALAEPEGGDFYYQSSW